MIHEEPKRNVITTSLLELTVAGSNPARGIFVDFVEKKLKKNMEGALAGAN